MIKVTKDEIKYPFSKGILARSLAVTDLPIEEIYSIVKDTYNDLIEEDIETIESKDLKNMVCEKLKARGYDREERFYRMTRQIRHLDKPILILIGGGPGVGKSTISAELGPILGINRVIGSDTIRQIMRSMISHDLIPTLHESTYTADKAITSPYVTDPLLHAFDQQVSLVNKGIKAVMERGIKEGLNIIINGVHIVPGYLDIVNDQEGYIFQYILEVPEVEKHKQRFYARADGSLRDPERYIERIDKIRRIQEYTLNRAEKENVEIIRNTDIDSTINEILNDIFFKLEGVI